MKPNTEYKPLERAERLGLTITHINRARSPMRRRLHAFAQLTGMWLAGLFLLLLAGFPVLIVILIMFSNGG